MEQVTVSRNYTIFVKQILMKRNIMVILKDYFVYVLLVLIVLLKYRKKWVFPSSEDDSECASDEEDDSECVSDEKDDSECVSDEVK